MSAGEFPVESKSAAMNVENAGVTGELDGGKTAISEKYLKHGDDALRFVGDERIEVSAEDNRRLRRKTDRYMLAMLSWIYVLQQVDKGIFGNGKIFGMAADLKLVGNEYSLASSMVSIAQLVWQPFSAYIIVRVPMRHFLCVIIFGWGVAQACIAACTTYPGLLVARFFLGIFEAGCLPAFSLLTAQWYRRSEQPMRVAVWYSSCGWATIFSALISYGLGHVQSPPSPIAGWRLIFLVTGIITVLTVPFIWWIIDGDVASSRFLNDQEKRMVIERLRANQTGTGSHEFKWDHVVELLADPKTYFFLMICTVTNVGAGVSQYIGPTLLNNFGFNVYNTALLTIPFGVLQSIFIFAGCYAGQVTKFKSAVIALFTLCTMAGCIMLYISATGTFRQGLSLGGYYMLAWNWGSLPLIISWVVANTGGQTKKSLAMGVFQLAGGAGNLIGPLLFSDADKPYYAPGIRDSMALFAAMAVCVGLQVIVLYLLNKRNERRRVANGKPRYVRDTSMSTKYEMYGHEDTAHLGQNALLDFPDLRNDEFQYVY